MAKKIMDLGDKSQSLLTFRVGPVLCCAPSLPVSSIIPPPKLTHVPGSAPGQPGIFRHGSHIVKVLDLRQKFGIDEADKTDPGILIVTLFDDEGFAFWVDQIIDVFDFPTTGWGNLPAAIPRGIFSRTLLLDDKIHLYSEFEKLATISELGYLRQYILQLQQQENPPAEKTATTQIHKDTPSATPVRSEAETEPAPAPERTATEKPKPEKAAIKPTALTSASISHSEQSTVRSKPRAITPPGQQDGTISQAQASMTKTATTRSAPASKPAKAVTASRPTIPAPPIEKETVPDQPVANYNPQETESSGGLLLLVMLLLFIGAISGGLYLLFNHSFEPVTPVYTETTTPAEAEPVLLAEDGIAEIEQVEKETSETEIVTTENKEEVFTETTTEATTAHEPETEIKRDYLANIEHRHNEILITVHEPAPVSTEETPALNQPDQATAETDTTQQQTEASETVQVQEAITKNEKNESDTVTENTPGEPPTEKKAEKPVAVKKEKTRTKTVREVVHIVVKGDTLWAIAKKYVHDPFRYPELARLSRIKNPDRIYPGNRVRIRFVKD